MEAILYAPLALLGAAVVLLAFAALASLRRARRAAGPGAPRASEALARAAAALGAAGGGDLATDGAFELDVAGRRLRAFGARPNKGRNVVVGIGVAAGAKAAPGVAFAGGTARQPLEKLPHVTLRQETGFDRLGKQLKVNLEIETGDAEFDRRVYVEGEGPREDVAALLSDRRVRGGALALLDGGCMQITFAEGEHLVAALWPAQLPAALTPESLRASAESLLAIADGLPPLRSREAGAPFLRAPWFEIVYLSLGIAAFPLASLSLFAWPPAGDRMTPLAAGAAALATALPLAFAVARFKGRPDALRRLCFALPGAMMLGTGSAVGGLAAANGWGDDSAAEHAVGVEDAYTRRSRNRPTHYLRVASWTPGEGPIELRVPGGRFEAIKAARRALVRTGRGRLGYEWVRSVEPL
ncbi:MAG TPA: hypothetical protein VFS43_16490 [Polyangiaceae bacterium]|nr:hypothetical protein [Polyangiaceae bacterium]